jgi:hypothetical protein
MLPVITAARTASPSDVGRSRWNSQPRAITLPPAAWMALATFMGIHWLNVQSLKPTAPCPAMRAICRHGPRTQLTKRTLPR